MSTRKGSPYQDSSEENGRILIYEGHDVSKNNALGLDPKTLDQPERTLNGSLTENGKFLLSISEHKKRGSDAEIVKVYEKIKDGIWVYNGKFRLVDAYQANDGVRNVFKFRLEIIDIDTISQKNREIEHNRMIPSEVKREVWQRDGGMCTQCRARDNLHFDHIVPFSRGGTSLLASNIQLLCARHNLEKSDKLI